MGKIMRNGVQYGVDTADILETVAQCDASTTGGTGATQVASAKALSELNSKIEEEYMNTNKEIIAEAITEKGIETSISDSFVQMASNIRAIPTDVQIHTYARAGASQTITFECTENKPFYVIHFNDHEVAGAVSAVSNIISVTPSVVSNSTSIGWTKIVPSITGTCQFKVSGGQSYSWCSVCEIK